MLERKLLFVGQHLQKVVVVGKTYTYLPPFLILEMPGLKHCMTIELKPVVSFDKQRHLVASSTWPSDCCVFYIQENDF